MKIYHIKVIFSYLLIVVLIINCSSNKDVHYYDDKIKDNPDDAELYYKRAKLLMDIDCDKAIQDFTKSLELGYEKSYLVYKNLAKCKIKLKDYDNALEDLNNSIRLNPEHADSYFERGYLNSFLKDYDKSNDDFNIAYSLDDELIASKLQIGENYYKKGSEYFNNKDFYEALEYYDKSEFVFNEFCDKLSDYRKREPDMNLIIDKIDVKKHYYYDLLYFQSIALIELENIEEAKVRIDYLKEINSEYNQKCDSLLNVIVLNKQK